MPLLRDGPSVSKFYDLAMLVLPGGMERTEEEYRLLPEAAGFRLTRAVPARTWVSVIEGEAKSWLPHPLVLPIFRQ